MRYFFAFAAAFAIATSAAFAAGAPTVVMPGQEKYTAQPGNYQMAVLYGNPAKAGFWVVRLKLPANWTFPVHYHPDRESVTVISGTFYAGIGSKMDKAHALAFPAGSFISVPPNLRHYAFTKGPAVIDISGTGPLKDMMVK
ncbi:MAG TPA: cupin domain-containing protein [Candidatus Baltobacteraceae bacterium]|nr:cupin domain-containing protein [Candidatus Baltobacteraceae bacterium]